MDSLFQFYNDHHLNEWFTTIGLALTIFGFIITFWQVRAGRKISEKTKDEVQQIKNDFHKLNAVSKLTSALSVAIEIRNLLNRENKEDYILIPDKCLHLKRNLNTARIALSNRTDD